MGNKTLDTQSFANPIVIVIQHNERSIRLTRVKRQCGEIDVFVCEEHSDGFRCNMQHIRSYSSSARAETVGCNYARELGCKQPAELSIGFPDWFEIEDIELMQEFCSCSTH